MESKIIDFTKIYTTNDHIYSLSLNHKQYFQYHHSTTLTKENICEISVLDRKNEVLRTSSYNLSDSDYNDFLDNKIIPVGFYLCNVNNFLVLIQNTLDEKCKIAYILELKTLNWLDRRLCGIDVNAKDVKFISHEGYIELNYKSTEKQNFTDRISIKNDNYDNDDFDECMNYMEFVSTEYNKLRPPEFFKPYTIFSAKEWSEMSRYFIKHYHYVAMFESAELMVQGKLGRLIDPKLESDRDLIKVELNKLMDEYERENPYTPSYKSNNNNWLQNASGTDDPDIMNDVFWNLD